MNGMLAQLAQFLGTGWLHDHVVSWLRTVPGLPPIVQSVHILSIACVMATVVMIDLRILGWAVPSQRLGEMMRRLLPWFWTALVLLLLSGAMFVITRPRRYFANPIFGIKFACLAAALVLTLVLWRMHRSAEKIADMKPSVAMKSIAALSLIAWLGVMMAGRWIAYADYLFTPPE